MSVIKFPRKSVGVSGQTRLNININSQTADDIKGICGRENLSVTEAVRRLIPMGAYIYRALLDGFNIQLVDKNGKVSKVVFDV